MSDESRYEEIIRRIQQRRQQAEAAPTQESLGGILDELNALGYLETAGKKRLRQVNCYGPEVFRGFGLPVWSGAVLWYKRRGYYEYRTLYLLGIWAISGSPAVVAVGTKELAFNAPAFNPESYYFHLKRRFDVYYAGDAAPPPEDRWRCHMVYDPARRLEQRQAVEAALEAWMDEVR